MAESGSGTGVVAGDKPQLSLADVYDDCGRRDGYGLVVVVPGASGDPTAPQPKDLGKKLDAQDHHQREDANQNGSGLKDGSGDGNGDTRDWTKFFLRHLNIKRNMYETDSPLPLSTPWTFWIDRTTPGMGVEQFEASLRKIKTVYSIHLFWYVCTNIPSPSSCNVRSSMHVTRDDRKPIWEDEYNKKGGTFRLRTQKKDTNKVWLELLMAVVGEQFADFMDGADEICAFSVSIREKEDVILIWNKDTRLANKDRVFECVHMILPDTHFISETYKPHVAHQSFTKRMQPQGAGVGFQNGRGPGIADQPLFARARGRGYGTSIGTSDGYLQGRGCGHGAGFGLSDGPLGGRGGGYEAAAGNDICDWHLRGRGIRVGTTLSNGQGHGYETVAGFRGRGRGRPLVQDQATPTPRPT